MACDISVIVMDSWPNHRAFTGQLLCSYSVITQSILRYLNAVGTAFLPFLFDLVGKSYKLLLSFLEAPLGKVIPLSGDA